MLDNDAELTKKFDGSSNGFSLDDLDTKGWDEKSLKDLAAAKNGASWAVQNLAHYSSNNLHGVGKDFDQARKLAELAQSMGNKLSAGFLDDLANIVKARSGGKPDEGVNKTMSEQFQGKVHEIGTVGSTALPKIPLDLQIKVKGQVRDENGKIIPNYHMVEEPHVEEEPPFDPTKYVYDTSSWSDHALKQYKLAQMGYDHPDEPSPIEMLQAYKDNGGFHGVTEFKRIPDSYECNLSYKEDTANQYDFNTDCVNPDTIIQPQGSFFVKTPDIEEPMKYTNAAGVSRTIEEMLGRNVKDALQLWVFDNHAPNEVIPPKQEQSSGSVFSFLGFK